MRLIDADALRETWVCQPGHDFEPSSFVYSIDNAPTVEPASQWHRVEDELPEGSCKVIVRCVCNSTGETDVTTAYYRNRYKKFHMTGNRSHWRVTQWMWPWDEPPKEEET